DPKVVGMFAGALMYTRYGWIKRHIMRSIEAKEGRDVDTSRDYEYTDWDAVDEFARTVLALAAAEGSTGGGRRSSLRNSCAFSARTIVDRLMSPAPTAGDSVSPAHANAPAASGIATTL